MQRWLTAQTFLDERDRRSLNDVGIDVESAAGGVSILKFTYERPLSVLFMMSGVVLLIASANLANLLLARSNRSQVAIQAALGASRGRLIRQSLTEGLLLAVLGGTAGIVVAALAARAVVALAFPATQYLPLNLQPGIAVLGFALLLSVITAAFFTAAPAWAMARSQPIEALRGLGRSNDQRSFVPRRSLVVTQIALSLILLSGAGLLTESLRRLQNQPLGFEAEHRVVVRIQPPDIAGDHARLESLYDSMLTGLRAIPGVVNATYALYSPMEGNNWSSGISIAGRPTSPDNRDSSSWNRIGPRYFETLGTRIVRGRAIEARDTPRSQRVAVVNEAFVRRFLANTDPIGASVGIGGASHATDYQIVGVSEDVKYTAAQAPTRPMIFLPAMQTAVYEDEGDTSVQNRSMIAGAAGTASGPRRCESRASSETRAGGCRSERDAGANGADGGSGECQFPRQPPDGRSHHVLWSAGPGPRVARAVTVSRHTASQGGPGRLVCAWRLARIAGGFCGMYFAAPLARRRWDSSSGFPWRSTLCLRHSRPLVRSRVSCTASTPAILSS